MNGEDDELWQEIKKAAKPLKNKKPVVTPTIKVRKPVIRQQAEKQVFPDRPPASPLPQKRLKQLRQQKIPVEAKIDLHGMTIVKAHAAITHFLKDAYRSQLRCVEVVTGKGDPERGTGLLKREFPQWLAEMSAIILHYEEKPLSRGGAFLVMLRRSKSSD